MRCRTYAVSRKLTEEFGVSGSAPAPVQRHSHDPLRLPRSCAAPGAYVEHASEGLPLANLAWRCTTKALLPRKTPRKGCPSL